jgi:hypothetical protein
MGAILELVTYMSTPLGMAVTAVGVVGAFYFMRWVLKD